MTFLIENEVLAFLVFGICIFFISYRWIDKVLSFIQNKTLNSQKEMLDIFEKMRIQKDKQQTVMWLWIISLSIAIITILITLPHILVGISLGLIGFLGTWILVAMIMKSLWERYCNLVIEQMVEGMTLMTNGMRVGLSVTQAMERVVVGVKGPLGSEFQLILNKIKIGMNLEEALNEMAQRIPKQDVIMLTTSVNILKETGGNLAETFATIAFTIRSRQKVQSKIKALTAQSMMQAKMISAVPFVLMAVLFFVNRNYIILLFTTFLGWISLFAILFLVIIGGQMMKKMAAIDI